MSKDDDINDLLGEAKPKAKTGNAALAAAKPPKKAPPKAEPSAPKATPKPKAEAKVATPAKKAPKAAPKKAKVVEAPVRAAKEPIEWEDGEKDKLAKKILKMKLPMNSKDIAEACGIPTRKLRPLLYSMARADQVVLKSGDSPVAGMTVKLGKAGK